MLITEQEIAATLASYDTPYEHLSALMHEVHCTLLEMRPILHAALMETRGPLNASPFADIAKAEALLTFALSAWEPER